VGVHVSVVFFQGCGPVMGRPWCKLQMAGMWTLGVGVAELWRRWGRWLEELVAWQR
jgi:hypothetical protein